MVPAVVQAQASVPIQECRQLAIDETGFIECLMLLLEQSERALTDVEENWRLEFAIEQPAEDEEPATAVEENSGFVVSTMGNTDNRQAPEGVVQSGVIAIVGDQTLGDNTDNGARVINVDEDVNGEKSLATEASAVAVLSSEIQARRFSAATDLYRQYRDQRCQWEASLVASKQPRSFYQACVVALNRERVLQLRRLLVEKRASDIGGDAFRGYYVQTGSGGIFQSCDHRQDWWVTGSDDALQSLTRRYDDITSESLEMVYVEFRARMAGAVTSGPGADFVASVELSALNLMRPIIDQDCGAVKSLDSGAGGENQTLPEEVDDELADGVDAKASVQREAVTVDDLGDAGFLYGYFSNWRSACAIGQLAVCRAQTNTDYSTEDAWILAVDRSSDGDWRLQLIPTTENKSMARLIQVSVDDTNISTLKIPDITADANQGVLIASGARARALLDPLRSGQSLGFDWIKPDQTGAKLSFSLVGITRALKYFDQAEK